MHEDNAKGTYYTPTSDSSDDENWSETYGSSDDEDWNASGGLRTPGKSKKYTRKYKANQKSSGSAQGPHTNGNKSPASFGRNFDETVKQKLNESYLENQYPTLEEKGRIAQKLGIDYHQVHDWFNNTCHDLSVGPSSPPVPDNSNNPAITVNPTVYCLPKKRGRPRKVVPELQMEERRILNQIDLGSYQSILPMPYISNNSVNTDTATVNNQSSLPIPNMNNSSVNTEPTTITSLPRKRGRPRKIVAEAQVEKGSIINQIDSGAYQTTLPMPNISNTSANAELTTANNPPNQINLSAYQSSIPMPNINNSSVNTFTSLLRKQGRPRKIVTEVQQVEKGGIINQIDSSAYQTTLPMPNTSSSSANTELSTVNNPLNQSSAYQSSLPMPNVSDRVANTEPTTVNIVHRKRGRPRKIVTEAQVEKGSAMKKIDSSAYQTTLSIPNMSNNSVNTVSVPRKRGRPRKIVYEAQAEKGSMINQIDSGAYQTALPMPNISNSFVNTEPTTVNPPNQIILSTYQSSLPVPNIDNRFVNTATSSMNYAANKPGKKEKRVIEIPLKEGHSIDQIDMERQKAIARELMKMKRGR